MELQTPIPITLGNISITHKQRVMLIGSCFTEHMGIHLTDCGFTTMVNPFGILYNPLSIAICLEHCLADKPLSDDDLVFHNGLWHSWLHHGSFSHTDKQQCLLQCNEQIHRAHDFLQEDCVLILTFGTAFAYTLNNTPHNTPYVVANCHKMPANIFTKRLLTINNITAAFRPLMEQLQGPILYTVSPIRHWADTPHGNQISKSTLLLAINELPTVQESYFPAYEIMMDELRDYRFYDLDMLHPSPLAVEIIWQRFVATYMNATTQELCKKFQQLHKMQAHRPLFPQSDAYQDHITRTNALENELKSLLQK